VPDPTRTLYYPAWVSTSGRVSLRWGAPCDRPGEAQRAGASEVRSGNASVAFVVQFAGGEKTPLPRYTSPPSACKIVEHWEALWDATEPPK
jgi:hypothetical protein